MTKEERTEYLTAIAEWLVTLQPDQKAVPQASRSTWAGRNYMSGWSQALHEARRRLLDAAAKPKEQESV